MERVTPTKFMRNEYQTVEVSEKLIRKLQRDLWVTRLFAAFSSLLMIVILAGGYYLYQVVQVYVKQAEGYVTEIMTYAETVKPALDQLSQVDVEALKGTMEQMSVAFAEIDFEKLAEQIESLDVESINYKIDALNVEAINEKINALDVESLNAKIYALDIEGINETVGNLDTVQFTETLENLNQAVSTVEEMSEKLRQVATIFS